MIFLKERLGLWGFVGAGLFMSGILLRNYAGRKALSEALAEQQKTAHAHRNQNRIDP